MSKRAPMRTLAKPHKRTLRARPKPPGVEVRIVTSEVDDPETFAAEFEEMLLGSNP